MASGNPASPSGATQGAWTQSGQQRPVQLVNLDKEGGLILDEGALSRCLEQGGVGAAPVCLVSIIGEQRRGKSFLLNCLLRRLRSPKATDTAWMSGDNAGLGEFECRSGTASVTKGVWIWSQPFWVQAQGRMVAVFLVDTEGCLDLKYSLDSSIKLAAFSILLSSYWIFNISSKFSRTEADYLEMFNHVAKEVGATCELPEMQHLDLLVRDWQLSEAYGTKGGQEYLRYSIQHLADSDEHPLAKESLQASSTRCYVMPHPGKMFTKTRAGMPGDMEKDFRQCLHDYISSVVSSAATHVHTDRAGNVLTAAELSRRIKNVFQDLKAKHYDFASPMKMVESLDEMRREKTNREIIKAARREYEEFVNKLDRDHQDMKECLSVEPTEMQQRLERKLQELLDHHGKQLKGKEPQRQAARKNLKGELTKKKDKFLSAYNSRFNRNRDNIKMMGGGVLGALGLGLGCAIGVSTLGVGGLVMLGGAVGFKVGSWISEKFSHK